MRLSRLVAIAALAVCPGIFADEAPKQAVKFDVDWHISLDAAGHVTQFIAGRNVTSDRIPEIRQRLEKAVREWQFVPGTVDGIPAPTETHLHVQVSLVPVSGESYQIRVDHAETGGWVQTYAAIHYPVSAIEHHVGGGLLLRVDYDTTGHMAHAELADQSAKADPALVRASIEAVKKWLFRPELVDGHPIAGAVFSPFCYSIGPSRKTCEYKAPGRSTPIGEGESFALNPIAKLQTPVEGKFL